MRPDGWRTRWSPSLHEAMSAWVEGVSHSLAVKDAKCDAWQSAAVSLPVKTSYRASTRHSSRWSSACLCVFIFIKGAGVSGGDCVLLIFFPTVEIQSGATFLNLQALGAWL